MRNDAQSFIFNALRNALYHTAQRRTYETRARILNFLVIVLGAATFADLLTPWGIKPIHLGGLTTLIGALQLTFDFAGRARTHALLQRDFYNALADFQAILDPDEADVAQAIAGLTAIMANEPPTMRAVDAKAYNDALAATGDYEKEERLKVPLWHRILKNVIAFEGSNYRSLREIENASANKTNSARN